MLQFKVASSIGLIDKVFSDYYKRYHSNKVEHYYCGNIFFKNIGVLVHEGFGIFEEMIGKENPY